MPSDCDTERNKVARNLVSKLVKVVEIFEPLKMLIFYIFFHLSFNIGTDKGIQNFKI